MCDVEISTWTCSASLLGALADTLEKARLLSGDDGFEKFQAFEKDECC